MMLIRLTSPLFVAAAVFLCVESALRGPALGVEYDFLARNLEAPPVSQEILLIETGRSGGARNVISPDLAGSVIMTMTEAAASTLIIQTPILGVSTGNSVNNGELLYRFDEEFKTINNNVKNLFEGIRTGAVAPEDADRFVENVVRLNDQGKARLLESAFRTSETEALELEKAFAVFGGAHLPVDLALSVLSHAGSGGPNLSSLYSSGYSRPQPDGDGTIRRIAPTVVNEGAESDHVVWSALKQRFADVPFPTVRDGSGAVVFKMPVAGASFREIPLELFMEYDELDKTLYRLLAEGVSLASYGGVLPDRYPAFLYENAMRARENLLENNEVELKARWIDSRNEYFLALDEFFSGEAERNVNASFERLIEEEKLDEKGVERLTLIWNGEMQKYGIAQEIWRQLAAIRGRLETALAGSFCIMGQSSGFSGAWDAPAGAVAAASDGVGAPAPPRLDLSAVDVSALLANSILTGNSVGMAGRRQTALFSALAAFLIVAILLKLRPVPSLMLGVVWTAFVYIGFSYRFIVGAEWLDPLIPASTAFAAALFSAFCAFTAHRSFRAKTPFP